MQIDMNKYLKPDPWLIIEKDFNPANHKNSESIFSLGNGRMGQRANFEEKYSGDMTLGNFIGGVYYPDPTKVGYWKHGYPAYFAKLVNLPSWIHIDIQIDGETLDLAKCKVHDFVRTLNMQEGILERSFVAEFKSGKRLKVSAKRFLSIVDTEIGAIRYMLEPINFSGDMIVSPHIDTCVRNDWSNFGNEFFVVVDSQVKDTEAFVNIQTLKTDFHVCIGTKFSIEQNGKTVTFHHDVMKHNCCVGSHAKIQCHQGEETVIFKYAAIVPSLHFDKSSLTTICKELLHKAYEKGFAALLNEHTNAWHAKWDNGDVIIDGDVDAQQAIRFCIFQLNQTYTGKDADLNIGPKGYTGEKYGGVTYWDTEAFCLPFYLATAGSEVAKNLLIYRYKHLPKAIANAENVGIKNGGALYPMVTVNGEECHNEWEITFEEIHRNGAIAYAIYNYVNYTGDKQYLVDYGLESLIALARFWAARVSFSEVKKKYVILGVTGPNEYENNVDNNWYTNTMACWTMQYAIEVMTYVKNANAEKFAGIIHKTSFAEAKEIAKWRDIIKKMYFPKDNKLGIFLQQEGYLNKEQMLASELNPNERPLNQNWSWDRILRSCFIKQADVLQGIYFLEDRYSNEMIKRNFDFYEPRTVHESSLSPCVYVIAASKLGYVEKAYELYLRTARLDLDDYNNEIAEGCHVTSMAGSWLAIVQGFGGMRVKDGLLHFNPLIIDKWKCYSFKILFREQLLKFTVAKNRIEIHNESDRPLSVYVFNKKHKVAANDCVKIDTLDLVK
jgi:maltose phosphorylase